MRAATITAVLVLTARLALGQTFSSGSTGVDGSLTPAPGTTITIQLPPSGQLDYTTIDIPVSTVVYFASNQRNTPVVLLVQGDVKIQGQISVNASGPSAGPGGYWGGEPAAPGLGPGGGDIGQDGRWVGPLSLLPLVGGSGGGGDASYPNKGGGGGGGILIAASGTIEIFNNSGAPGTVGAITADGAYATYGTAGPVGDGSGGAVRLVANKIAVTRTGYISACTMGSSNNCGVIRLEAPPGGVLLTGETRPDVVISDINPVLTTADGTPSLGVVSIGGFPVSSYAGSHPNAVDLLLPSTLSDPIPIVVTANNVPVGSQVRVRIVGSTSATATGGVLSGTLASSSTTINISGLDRSAATQFFFFTTFAPSDGSAPLVGGHEGQVARIRVETTLTGEHTIEYLRKDGSRIPRK